MRSLEDVMSLKNIVVLEQRVSSEKFLKSVVNISLGFFVFFFVCRDFCFGYLIKLLVTV